MNTITRFRQSDAVIVRLDNDRNFYKLTDVAAEFWNLLDGKKSASEICDKLAQQHRVPEGSFDKDARTLVRGLIQHQLAEEGGLHG